MLKSQFGQYLHTTADLQLFKSWAKLLELDKIKAKPWLFVIYEAEPTEPTFFYKRSKVVATSPNFLKSEWPNKAIFGLR